MTGIIPNGGDDRVRTDDPHNAIVVLFQLSYVPIFNIQVQDNLPIQVL